MVVIEREESQPWLVLHTSSPNKSLMIPASPSSSLFVVLVRGSYCDEFIHSASPGSAELYMRLSCDEVCLRNSVVQRDCNDTTFSTDTPLLPVESAVVGIPAVVNFCAETSPGSGVWMHTGCTDYVPDIGLFSDGNCSVPLGTNITGQGAVDFRNTSVVNGLHVRVPDPVRCACLLALLCQ